MELKNNIVKKQANTGVTTYEANGVQVTLSFDTVKNYLVNGGGNVSNQELALFIGMCRANSLNPFNRDCYLIKYGSNSPAAMVTAEQVFLKRAQKNPDFDGLEAGVILVEIETGQLIERQGTYFDPENEKLVGGWCKVYKKGKRIPSYESVNLSEYIGRKKDGQVNDQWARRPATMIRKVARVHALKEAFPSDLGGLYSQEEMGDAGDVILDESQVIVPQEAEEPDPVYEGQTVFDQPVGQMHQAPQPGPYQGEPMDPAAALCS